MIHLHMRFNMIINIHKFRATGFSVTPASQVCTFTILTLQIVGN